MKEITWAGLRRRLPGLRIIKTGIAVTLCLLFYRLIGLEMSFYALVAIVISMDKTIFLSFTAGKNRLIGTAIGAALGMGFSLLLPDNAWSSGLGIILLIYLLNQFKLNAAIVIASVVFLAIMIAFGSADHPINYSLLRLMDTSVGVFIAWLVNILCVPYNNLPAVKEKLTGIRELFNAALDDFTLHTRQLKSHEISDAIAALEEELEIYQHQFTWRPKPLSAETVGQLKTLLVEAHAELVVLNHLEIRQPLTADRQPQRSPLGFQLEIPSSEPAELAWLSTHHRRYFEALHCELETIYRHIMNL